MGQDIPVSIHQILKTHHKNTYRSTTWEQKLSSSKNTTFSSTYLWRLHQQNAHLSRIVHILTSNSYKRIWSTPCVREWKDRWHNTQMQRLQKKRRTCFLNTKMARRFHHTNRSIEIGTNNPSTIFCKLSTNSTLWK